MPSWNTDPTGTFPIPSLPTRWVASQSDLEELCHALSRHELIALDVETTFHDHDLRLIQVATFDGVGLIDPLAVRHLRPFQAVMEDASVVKVIHNASFERRVLRKLGIEIENVVDTLKLSRQSRAGVSGGHSLKAVCLRELDLVVDKRPQTSNWSRRPLSRRQLAYAAMDAEVLLSLFDVLALE